jgi:hypothetical protein
MPEAMIIIEGLKNLSIKELRSEKQDSPDAKNPMQNCRQDQTYD